MNKNEKKIFEIPSQNPEFKIYEHAHTNFEP